MVNRPCLAQVYAACQWPGCSVLFFYISCAQDKQRRVEKQGMIKTTRVGLGLSSFVSSRWRSCGSYHGSESLGVILSDLYCTHKSGAFGHFLHGRSYHAVALTTAVGRDAVRFMSVSSAVFPGSSQRREGVFLFVLFFYVDQ